MSQNTSKIVEIEVPEDLMLRVGRLARAEDRTVTEFLSAEVVRIARGDGAVGAAVDKMTVNPGMADFRIGWRGLRDLDAPAVSQE
ncbi:MAG: hypothetical protein GC150_14100 [Rhizobiales bacterium]|nr:hypothetical protein [Hyphomicrobiales bacterium]